MVRVKICGITNSDDALHAAESGADALGFVFYSKSPRYIAPADAGEIIKALPPFVVPVGVVVDMDKSELDEAVRLSGIKVIQFHGSEPPDFCRSFGMPYVKAFRVRDMDSLKGLELYRGAAAFLLDAYCESELGGTGVTFNWDIAAYAKGFGRVILAGGLTPENVADAVRKVRPYAVDVASGVEASRGKKDPELVTRFIASAKQ